MNTEVGSSEAGVGGQVPVIPWPRDFQEKIQELLEARIKSFPPMKRALAEKFLASGKPLRIIQESCVVCGIPDYDSYDVIVSGNADRMVFFTICQAHSYLTEHEIHEYVERADAQGPHYVCRMELRGKG